MKTLYLLRHGHAESKVRQPDINRNLDEKGRNEVGDTAGKMLKSNINPSLIISSHANRAYQTAEIVAKTIGYNIKNIEIENGIYYTDTQILVEILEQQEDKYHSILLVGHNPSLSFLANLLCNDYIDLIPTAGLVAIELHSNSWDTFREYDTKFLFQM